MDIMFFGSSDEASDEALRASCEKNGNVVAGSYINYTSAYKTDADGKGYIDHFSIESVEQPFFADCCNTGFVNVSPDDDGIVRSVMMSDSDDSGRMWINYAGKPGDYEYISFVDVIEGKVDPRICSGCIVFVGAYGAGMQDQYSIPNSSAQMFGVEIHANILQCMIDDRMPLPVSRLTAALISAAAATDERSKHMSRFLIIPELANIEEHPALAKKYDLGFECNDYFSPKMLDDEVRLQHTIADAYIKNWTDYNEKYLGGILKENPDMNIYIENMFDRSPYMLQGLSERLIKYDNFGVCCDYAHAMSFGRGTDIDEWVEALAPYIKHMHINDNDLENDLHLAIGDGKIDWNKFAEYYEKYFYKSTILIEVSGIEKQRRSAEFLENLGLLG